MGVFDLQARQGRLHLEVRVIVLRRRGCEEIDPLRDLDARVGRQGLNQIIDAAVFAGSTLPIVSRFEDMSGSSAMIC